MELQPLSSSEEESSEEWQYARTRLSEALRTGGAALSSGDSATSRVSWDLVEGPDAKQRHLLWRQHAAEPLQDGGAHINSDEISCQHIKVNKHCNCGNKVRSCSSSIQLSQLPDSIVFQQWRRLCGQAGLKRFPELQSQSLLGVSQRNYYRVPQIVSVVAGEAENIKWQRYMLQEHQHSQHMAWRLQNGGCAAQCFDFLWYKFSFQVPVLEWCNLDDGFEDSTGVSSVRLSPRKRPKVDMTFRCF
jgi:hypothetical protein